MSRKSLISYSPELHQADPQNGHDPGHGHSQEAFGPEPAKNYP